MNIGIIAYGVVGKAICAGFENKATLHVFDPNYSPQQSSRFKASLEEVWQACDFTFIAAPTPQKLIAGEPGGVFDSSHIDQIFADIAAFEREKKSQNKIVILVSTTLPSKIKAYLKCYPELKLIVFPEFLTEKNSVQDFLNPAFRIIGGDPQHARAVQALFEQYSACAPCKIGYCDAIGASFIKYILNTFMALKVSFLNQFYDLFQHSGSHTDWQALSELLHYDTRIGTSHQHVPGHDGDRGWGGKCLPKDTNAIMRDAREQNSPLSLLEEAWEYNLRVRSKIDWK